MTSSTYDVVVIGAGAVGCAVARQVMRWRGAGKEDGKERRRCLLLEKNPDVLAEASSGNNGHLATNFYYGPSDGRAAPLESALTRRAADTAAQWLEQQQNVPRRKAGFITVARDSDEMCQLRRLLSAGVKNGVRGLRELSREELLAREPGLAPTAAVAGGVLSEEEFVVDSFLMALSNLYEALERGCELRTSCEVTRLDRADGAWKVATAGGEVVEAGCVVNCGGNYSDEVHRMAGAGPGAERGTFDIRPARGEFLVVPPGRLRSDPSSSGLLPPRAMVATAPTEATAGLYVFESVYGGAVVVGPTHHVQDSKEDRLPRPSALEDLLSHGRRLFPSAFASVASAADCYSYCGLRPSCPQSRDYQVSVDADRRFATVGAIRSTGLTASRAIAEHVCGLLLGGGGDGPAGEEEEEGRSYAMPKPEVTAVSGDNDDNVIRVGKYEFRVTHPLSQLGIFGKMF